MHTGSYLGYYYASCIYIGCTENSELQCKNAFLIYIRHCLLLTETKIMTDVRFAFVYSSPIF